MMFSHFTRDDFRSVVLPLLDACFKDASSADYRAITAHTPDEWYNLLGEDEKNQHDILSMGKLWLRLRPTRDSEVYKFRYYQDYRETYPNDGMTYDDWMTILDVLEDDEYAEGAMMMDGDPAGERAVNTRLYFLSYGITFPTSKQDGGSEEDSADEETSVDEKPTADGKPTADEKPTQEKSMGIKRVAEGPVGDRVPTEESPPTKKQRQA